jgi:hypothetical protein
MGSDGWDISIVNLSVLSSGAVEVKPWLKR